MKPVHVKQFALAALGALSLAAASVHAQAIRPQGDPPSIQGNTEQSPSELRTNQLSQAQAAPPAEDVTTESVQRDAVAGRRFGDDVLQYNDPTGSNPSTHIPNQALRGRPPYALGQAQ